MQENRLVGMNRVKRELEKLLEDKEVYQRTRVGLPHFLIRLDPGNGQTCVTEQITDVLVDHDLREFHGLDEYLEYRPDGTLDNLKWMFLDIDFNAIYDTVYKGVIAMDVSGMAAVLNEYQMKYFESHLEEVAENATLILYYSTGLGKREASLLRRLQKVLKNYILIDDENYTTGEYADMILQNITERGIEIRDTEQISRVVREVISAREINNAKDAVALAEKMMFYADFKSAVPVLNFGKALDFKKKYSMEG